jgi:hypothetical protein
MAVDWKEDDHDTLVLFLETILDGYRKGTLSRAQATIRIIEAFSQAGTVHQIKIFVSRRAAFSARQAAKPIRERFRHSHFL